MAKLVFHKAYGGYGPISKAQYEWMIAHGGRDYVKKSSMGVWGEYYALNCTRDNELWIQCVETLTEEYGKPYKIFTYDENDFEADVQDYDGLEWVELIPIVDITKLIGASADEIKCYLKHLNIKYKGE